MIVFDQLNINNTIFLITIMWLNLTFVLIWEERTSIPNYLIIISGTCMIFCPLSLSLFSRWINSNTQGCQYRTGGRTGLATDTIYFRYRSILVYRLIPMYRFGFTAIFLYLYIYIYIFICMCLCIYIYIYILINIKVYHKTFPQFRTNYSWF